MKNFLLSLFVCLPALAFAQTATECNDAGLPASCCYDCTCYLCTDVSICEGQVGASPSLCQLGGCENCGTDHPNDLCDSWTWNYYGPYQMGIDQFCVPIDGGLGFLIAGGLGMGVLGVRRRKELELEA